METADNNEAAKADKVKDLVFRLNEIQSKVYLGKRLSADDMVEWRALAIDIKWYGYVLRKKHIKNALGFRIGTVWRAVPKNCAKRTRHFSAEWRNVNMRPNDGKPYCKGDCTTRAMSFCLQGVFTYREIEHEQYRLAAEKNAEKGLYRGDCRRKVRRNSNGTWDLIMTDIGYVWLRLARKVRRDNLAAILRNSDYPIITHSSGHVAVVDKGEVVDSWDSRHGRCEKILVKAEDCERFIGVLRTNGITAVED